AAAGTMLLAASSVATPANAAEASALHVGWFDWFSKGPTQKEVFELRTQCAQLAKAKVNELNEKGGVEKGGLWANPSSSQYDLKHKRRYVEIMQHWQQSQETELLHYVLFDG